MCEDTLYWLFSTIAQTYGAILGIFAMITVYRLETLSHEEENRRKAMHELVDPFLGEAVRGLPSEDLIEEVKKFLEGGKKDPKSEEIAKKVKSINLKRYLPWRKKIGCQFKWFILIHLFIIIIAILGILLISLVAPLPAAIIYVVTVFLLVISSISIIFLGWSLFSDEGLAHKIWSMIYRKDRKDRK